MRRQDVRIDLTGLSVRRLAPLPLCHAAIWLNGGVDWLTAKHVKQSQKKKTIQYFKMQIQGSCFTPNAGSFLVQRQI